MGGQASSHRHTWRVLIRPDLVDTDHVILNGSASPGLRPRDLPSKVQWSLRELAKGDLYGMRKTAKLSSVNS